MTYALRPPMLDDLGLSAALEWLVEDRAGRSGIYVTCDIAEVDVDRETATVLYRAAQQTLEDTARRQSLEQIFLHFREEARCVLLTLSENLIDAAGGSTFGFETSSQRAMRESVAALGGRVEFRRLVSGAREPENGKQPAKAEPPEWWPPCSAVPVVLSLRACVPGRV